MTTANTRVLIRTALPRLSLRSLIDLLLAADQAYRDRLRLANMCPERLDDLGLARSDSDRITRLPLSRQGIST